MNVIKVYFAYFLAFKSVGLNFFGASTTSERLTSLTTLFGFFQRYGYWNSVRALWRAKNNFDGDYLISLVKAAYAPTNKKNDIYSIIEVTNNCPFDCEGCYVPDRRSKNFMSKDLLRSSIERVSGSAIILIQGGEPLQKTYIKDLVDVLLEFPEQVFTIVTSGVYISRNGMGNLLDLKSTMFAISINGLEETNDSYRFNGSFKFSVDAMEKLRDAGRYFVPVVTLSKSNYLEATSKEFLTLLSQSGAKDVKYLIEESGREGLRLSAADLDVAKERARCLGNLLFTTFNKAGTENVMIINPYGRSRNDRTGFGEELMNVGYQI
jgi:MoaA/NifB/PqqE/SkfB family radical SAM enzyme